MIRLASYRGREFRFSYLRTKDDAEIDLIVDRPGLPRVVVEFKSSDRVKEEDARVLNQFAPDFKNAEMLLLSRDPEIKRYGKVEAMPLQTGLLRIVN